MAQELSQIADTPDQKLRVEQYREWLHKAVAAGQDAQCRAYIDHSESCPAACWSAS